MYSLKQALLLREAFGIDVWIYYIDMRAAGRGYEELYWRAQENGVVFVRGKVLETGMNGFNGKLTVTAEDPTLGNVIEQEFDCVAIATPMIPSLGLNELAHKFSLPLGSDGFVQEKHPKLEPLNSLVPGVFAAGCALGPKDVRDAVSDALGAAAKVSSFLGNGYIVESPEKAFVICELCDGCGLCLKICPLNAITLTDGKAKVNPLLCNGCSGCIPDCPKEAIDFKNATRKQIFSTLTGLLSGKRPDEVRIIAFVDRTIAYASTDFLGRDRIQYPLNIRIVPVPSTAIIGLRHLLNGFAYGADAFLVIEGMQEVDEKFTKKRMAGMSLELAKYGIEKRRVRYSYVPLPVYKKTAELFTIFTDLIKEIGPLPEGNRNAIKQEILS
jgi:heterodisulfide reductase subunit A